MCRRRERHEGARPVELAFTERERGVDSVTGSSSCENCGAAVTMSASFCEQCGARQGVGTPERELPPAPLTPTAGGAADRWAKRRRDLLQILGVLALSAVAVGVVLALHRSPAPRVEDAVAPVPGVNPCHLLSANLAGSPTPDLSNAHSGRNCYYRIEAPGFPLEMSLVFGVQSTEVTVASLRNGLGEKQRLNLRCPGVFDGIQVDVGIKRVYGTLFFGFHPSAAEIAEMEALAPALCHAAMAVAAHAG